MTSTADGAASWEEILTRLENDLHATALRLEQPGAEVETPAPWAPPTHLGPLPRHLLRRAKELVSRQDELRLRLGNASTAAHRQQAFASKVAQATTTRPQPVYLDLEA